MTFLLHKAGGKVDKYGYGYYIYTSKVSKEKKNEEKTGKSQKIKCQRDENHPGWNEQNRVG
jgi:hypothetical protein